MNTAQVDFQQLRIKHILYKSKIRSALYGGAYDDAFFSASGPVNMWFTNVGQATYHREAELQQLSLLQNELNRTARQYIDLYQAGKIDEAHEGLEKVEALSEKFLDLLSKMEQRLR
ncbi:histidine kinase [Rufibacter soli]